MVIYQGVHRPAICMWRSKFRIYTIFFFETMQAAAIQNHETVNVRNIGQGKVQHRKCKRLKLGGGQAYDR
jgi:hypothetical protein